MSYAFDSAVATSFVAHDPRTSTTFHSGTLSPSWRNNNNTVHGGYLLAVLVDAAKKNVERRDSEGRLILDRGRHERRYMDLVTISAVYVAPARPAENAVVAVRRIRVGGRWAVVEAVLMQSPTPPTLLTHPNLVPLVRATITLGTLPPSSQPPLPPPAFMPHLAHPPDEGGTLGWRTRRPEEWEKNERHPKMTAVEMRVVSPAAVVASPLPAVGSAKGWFGFGGKQADTKQDAAPKAEADLTLWTRIVGGTVGAESAWIFADPPGAAARNLGFSFDDWWIATTHIQIHLLARPATSASSPWLLSRATSYLLSPVPASVSSPSTTSSSSPTTSSTSSSPSEPIRTKDATDPIRMISECTVFDAHGGIVATGRQAQVAVAAGKQKQNG
ncbi:hypothetical protein M427DRAFT_57868, partial [Gonapodya prolifera JEL478]